MSTDDSVSEDVSSSAALSHGHVSADGDVGKESEASLVSSEGTSASGLAVSEERHSTSKTPGGAVETRPMDLTPACNKIRSLCLSSDEAFEQGKSLPFINPSSLETLRALVQEIQSSGETDPEIWKDCEGRWLHLFQLVEKQYQEQILAQQEQYQCQIQLIQDEIKALVQLQNRQTSVPPQSDFSPTPVTKMIPNTKDFMFPSISKRVPSDSDSLAAPVLTPFSSPSPPAQQGEERATTGLSSGYGTMSAWDTALEPAGSPGEDEEEGRGGGKLHWSPDFQEGREAVGTEPETSPGLKDPAENQQKTSGSSQQLTSWAQRQKLRPRKSKPGPGQIPEYQDPPQSLRGATETQDQRGAAGPSSSALPLRRSDSLVSEASGLTYWRLNESDLYRPLPDSFDSGAYLLLQEASISLTQEPRLSLREIYQTKQRAERRSDWDGSGPSSPQVLTLDPAPNLRLSDRTSGFTSPSHFSSPSFPHLYPRVGTPVSPDSMVGVGVEGGGPHPADSDCVSDSSSLSPSWAPVRSASRDQNHRPGPQRRASEEEGSHSSTLKPPPPSTALRAPPPSTAMRAPHMDRAASLEDPVVLSLLRQNLREKHSRHVADLKAYYESEIQTLREKLKLRDLPQDLEKSNQVLTERCRHLEKALAEATGRIQDLEASNSSLEKKLAEWPERYAVAAATVTSLQQRLEETKRSEREKEAQLGRMKNRVRQLEEEEEKRGGEEDEREARREREYRMLQDLLGEYDSLMKEHEAVKNNLVSTENKLVDANDQISELRRVVSKLESQVKQLEHENQARLRFSSHSNTQPSGAGLFHHPDLLLSPSKTKPDPDVSRRKSPCPPSDQLGSSRKSHVPQTSVHKRASYPVTDQSSGTGSSVDTSSAAGSWICASPPESEQPAGGGRRDASCAMTPMMRALIQLEETKATETRAPWVGNTHRTTVGFVERRHKDLVQERADRDQVRPAGGAVVKSRSGAAALLRAQRSLSPDGHRSSSLPPQRHSPAAATPTKRETLIRPVSAKSSPKRCPTENYSTAFGHMMPREEHLHSRLDGHVDKRRHSFHSSSPRKRLQFTADRENDLQESLGSLNPADVHSQPGWEDQGPGGGPEQQDVGEDPSLVLDRLQSLSEAERLFDELTQEKQQIEAALSRMPAAGSRVSLQTRLDEVALENRLERLNRELGSLRMTLKRFHVLRSSVNI